MDNFGKELEKLINRHCVENASNTPDFIVSSFLIGCLKSWNQSIAARDKWYGDEKWNTRAHDVKKEEHDER